MKTTNIIVVDSEIKHGVITEDNPAQPGYQYAQGWTDYLGMGISTICAYDFYTARLRVFCEDNFDQWLELVRHRDGVVSFNGNRFDNPLLSAHGLGFDLEKSIDLAALIWQAAGIPEGEHPKGLGLDAICRANDIPGKTGNAVDAPQDWQQGRIGRVIDYCLGDVRSETELYTQILNCGYITDPRTFERLFVRLPK